MRVTVPIPIVGAMLLSTSLPDLGAGEVAYASGTTYPVDAEVIDPATHRKYKSLQDGNLGKPLPVYPETKTDWWFDVGTTNQRAMFDLKRNSKSIGLVDGDRSSLAATFAPGVRCNTIGIVGLEADSITIEVRRPDGTLVYTYTETLIIKESLDCYTYAYDPFQYRPSLVRFDLPPFVDAQITLYLTKVGAGVACGGVVVGTYAYIGTMEMAPESDPLNFSTIERDLYGTASLVPRRSVPKTSQQLLLERKYVNAVNKVRKDLNAVPALWTGLDDSTNGYFDLLLILGIYKKFSITPAHPGHARVGLELEEI